MHSSISSSERGSQERKSRVSIIWILVGLVAIAVACETAVSYGLHRVSKIIHRTENEYRDSLAIPKDGPNGKPTMLLLGNSLLLEGLDYPTLKQDLAGKYDVHRLVFEQTEYLEQYYLLQTLLRRGARPQYLVFCTSVNHLIGDDTRGEFMSQYLDAIDVGRLGTRQHYDPTTLSSQLFAHFSEWFANRAEIRKYLLGVAMPDVQNLTAVLVQRVAPPVSPDQVRAKSAPRLRELKELCDQYGVRLAILIPPSLRQDHGDVVASIGNSLGVPVLVPSPPGSLGSDSFRDGFHLTSAAAQAFTQEVVPGLNAIGH